MTFPLTYRVCPAPRPPSASVGSPSPLVYNRLCPCKVGFSCASQQCRGWGSHRCLQGGPRPPTPRRRRPSRPW